VKRGRVADELLVGNFYTEKVHKSEEGRQQELVLAFQAESHEIVYGWIPHNAGFGFLDLAPSILHSNWFWDYIS
jgi:hypothetical protein